MNSLVDTSVLIDLLRGHAEARHVLERERALGPLHASEITRIEVLAGMRASETGPTIALLDALVWHDVTKEVAETAGALGRQWLPGHSGIDSADLAIAATALLNNLQLLTLNARHFPMLDGIKAPY